MYRVSYEVSGNNVPCVDSREVSRRPAAGMMLPMMTIAPKGAKNPKPGRLHEGPDDQPHIPEEAPFVDRLQLMETHFPYELAVVDKSQEDPLQHGGAS
jgi:hypothetical protein